MRLTAKELGLSSHEVTEIEFGQHEVTHDPLVKLMYLGCNEIAELEEMLDGSLQFLFSDPKQSGRVGNLIALLWVGMRVFEPGLTRQDVGRVLSRQAPQIPYFWGKVTECIRKSIPGFLGEPKGAPKAPLESAVASASAAAINSSPTTDAGIGTS